MSPPLYSGHPVGISWSRYASVSLLSPFTFTVRPTCYLCNPFRDVNHSYYYFNFYFHQRLLLPVCGRIFHELQQLGPIFCDIPSVPLHTRYCILSSQDYRSLHYIWTLNNARLHWCFLYSSLASQYPNYTEVFSDGSLQCAVWSAYFSLQAQYPHSTSIFTAELYALFCATSYVSILHKHYLILTDCLSCVTVFPFTILAHITLYQRHLLYSLVFRPIK